MCIRDRLRTIHAIRLRIRQPMPLCPYLCLRMLSAIPPHIPYIKYPYNQRRKADSDPLIKPRRPIAEHNCIFARRSFYSHKADIRFDNFCFLPIDIRRPTTFIGYEMCIRDRPYAGQQQNPECRKPVSLPRLQQQRQPLWCSPF